MKITNNMDLPLPFARFAEARTPATAGSLSVTRLIGPAWIRALTVKHWDEIEQDVSEQVWALFGSSVHDLLEKYSSESELVEEKIEIEIDGHTITGRPDVLAIDSGILSDWKVSSAWSIVLGVKPEWEAQLNVYAYGLRQAGKNVRAIQNIVFVRDWTRAQALRSADYPHSMVQIVPLNLWPAAKVEAYIRERLAAHADPKPCSPDERWARPAVWAVMREGRKSAVKLFDNEDGARDFAEGDKKLSVVLRPGEEVRCKGYCAVSKFCDQWDRGTNED